MSWRVVVVRGRCKLEYKLGYLVCRGEEVKKLFLNEIEYGAILKGSQTIGSGRCIIARKSEFSAFLRFRVEIFLVLVYIISGICTTIRIGRLLGSFTIQRRGKGSFLFGYSCLRASALQNAR